MFIESATFDPVSIRRTRKALEIQTDACYRFERGADVGFAPQAALMAASLLTPFGGKTAREMVDVYPKPRKTKEIVLRGRRVADLLGVDVGEAVHREDARAPRLLAQEPRRAASGGSRCPRSGSTSSAKPT